MMKATPLEWAGRYAQNFSRCSAGGRVGVRSLTNRLPQPLLTALAGRPPRLHIASTASRPAAGACTQRQQPAPGAHLVRPEEGRQAGQGDGGGVKGEAHHIQLLAQHLQWVEGSRCRQVWREDGSGASGKLDAIRRAQEGQQWCLTWPNLAASAPCR